MEARGSGATPTSPSFLSRPWLPRSRANVERANFSASERVSTTARNRPRSGRACPPQAGSSRRPRLPRSTRQGSPRPTSWAYRPRTRDGPSTRLPPLRARRRCGTPSFTQGVLPCAPNCRPKKARSSRHCESVVIQATFRQRRLQSVFFGSFPRMGVSAALHVPPCRSRRALERCLVRSAKNSESRRRSLTAFAAA